MRRRRPRPIGSTLLEVVVWFLGAAGCALARKDRKAASFAASTGWALICVAVIAILHPERRTFGDVFWTFFVMWIGGWVLRVLGNRVMARR